MNVTSAPAAGVTSAPSSNASAIESLLILLRGVLGKTSLTGIAITSPPTTNTGSRFSTARQRAPQAALTPVLSFIATSAPIARSDEMLQPIRMPLRADTRRAPRRDRARAQSHPDPQR